MSAVTFIHVSMGTIAIFAGAIALIATKGSRLHRSAGNLFFLSMLIMAASGITIAIMLPMAISVLAGIITIYLVTTSWIAARRPDGMAGPFDYAWLAIALAIMAGGMLFGLEAQNSPTGLKDGIAAAPHYFFAGLAGLLAMGDSVMLARRGFSGKQRVARHLWRMCLAYFIATGSLFTGPGATVFPQAVRDSGILNLAEPLVLILMLFWVFRVLATGWYDGQPSEQTNRRTHSS